MHWKHQTEFRFVAAAKIFGIFAQIEFQLEKAATGM